MSEPRALRFMFSLWPFLVRALAVAIGAFAVSWGVTGEPGIIAAVSGAVLGSLVGHGLGRTKLRLPIILIGFVGLSVGLWTLTGLAAEGTWIPRALGPSNALVVFSVLRYGVVSLGVVASLRAIAARKPNFVAIELAGLAATIIAAFSAHRDGVLSRPHWLADWAFRHDWRPQTIFLAMGFAAAGLLAVVLLAEMKSSRSVSSILTLGGIGLVVFLWFSIGGLQDCTPKHDPVLPVDIPITDDPGDPPDASFDDAGSPLDGGTDDAGDGASGAGDADAAEGGTGGQGEGGIADADLPDVKMKDLQPPDSGFPSPDDQAQPVAVVKLKDTFTPMPGALREGDPGLYYFRTEVMSQFNGTRLAKTGRADADRDVFASFPLEDSDVAEPPPSFGLPLPKGADAGVPFRTLIKTEIGLLESQPTVLGFEGTVHYEPFEANSTFKRRYDAQSYVQNVPYDRFFGARLADPKWSPDLLAYYTKPPDDPRYKQLAEKLVAENLKNPKWKDDPFAKAFAVKIGLQKLLTYTTTAVHEGTDPTADMLWSSHLDPTQKCRAGLQGLCGYCVHFAHAAVMLFRTLGIPARASVGFMTEEKHRKGQAIIITSDRGHMWPELYIEGAGWVVFDIYAERNVDLEKPCHGAQCKPPVAPDLADLLSKLLDKKKKPPGGKMNDDTQCAPDDGLFSFSECKCLHDHQLASTWCYAWRILTWFGVPLAAILVLLYAIKGWRRVAPVISSTRSLPRVAYRKALDLLSEAGYARDFGESRESFAARVKPLSPSFEKLTALHLAARLGNPDADRRTRPEYSEEKWNKYMRDLRREIAKKQSLWRRLIGRLHPASFFYSR